MGKSSYLLNYFYFKLDISSRNDYIYNIKFKNKTKEKKMTTMTENTANQIVRNSVFSYLKDTESAQFCYLKYQNEAGELSTYKLLLNVNFTNLYKDDLETLKNLPTMNEIEKKAKDELMKSIQKSLDTEFQHSKNPTKNMTTIHKSIKFHDEKDEMYLHCISLEKKIHVAGEYKSVKSSEKTIAKKNLKKNLKQNKIRFFRINLNQIERISANGHRILIVAA